MRTKADSGFSRSLQVANVLAVPGAADAFRQAVMTANLPRSSWHPSTIQTHWGKFGSEKDQPFALDIT